jgi:hypothetical protein
MVQLLVLNNVSFLHMWPSKNIITVRVIAVFHHFYLWWSFLLGPSVFNHDFVTSRLTVHML